MYYVKSAFIILAISVMALIAGGNTPAQAATISLDPLFSLGIQVGAENENLQSVGYRHCRRWRNRCAERWGTGTGGYYRCLRRQGCSQRRYYRSCRAARHECASRWGWNNRGYYRCLRNYGCR